MSVKRLLQTCAMTGALLAGAELSAEELRGRLQLLDGSILHGEITGVEVARGIVWKHPSASKPIIFKTSAVADIRLERYTIPPAIGEVQCRASFQNGDEIVGNLLTFDATNAVLQSWLSPKTTAPVSAIASLAFSSRGFKPVYEGPNGLEGWVAGKSERSWEFRDGAFASRGPEVLGRDFGLTTSSIFEFDLEWRGPFSLLLTAYSQAIDRVDYTSSAYMVYIMPGGVRVQRFHPGTGSALLGEGTTSAFDQKGRAHIEIRCSKEEGAVVVLVDGKQILQARDAQGFGGKGGGIAFQSQIDGGGLRISDIRLSEWDGRVLPEADASLSKTNDLVHLTNRDRVPGQAKLARDGRVTVQSRAGALEIPMERINQIDFAGAGAVTPPMGAWQIRAGFPNKQALSMRLTGWTNGIITGESQNFGPIKIDPGTLRTVQFNVGKVAQGTTSDDALLNSLDPNDD